MALRPSSMDPPPRLTSLFDRMSRLLGSSVTARFTHSGRFSRDGSKSTVTSTAYCNTDPF